MDKSTEVSTCCCNATPKTPVGDPLSKVRSTGRSVPSVLLSILIAFFPKCPLCWAVYMSMFSCLGIAKLPYMSWLLPVLLLFLGVHMFMLYKKALRIGFAPFIISLFGALILLFCRLYFPTEQWLLFIGMASIISGSLLNSFSGNRLTLKTQPIQ